ncbi:MAG: FtsH protease activity modulator HflK [Armatimonadetes bacterium]|nr:FtsH protease activity modulator HflK [Armatimonadota bacterium]
MKQLFRGWSWEHWYNLAREDIDAAFASVRRAALIAMWAGIGLWVLSGFHAIRQDEVGVETICGRVLRSVEQPGLRYRLPWPMGSVRRVAMQRQQRVTVGIPKGGLTAAARRGETTQAALDTTVADQFDPDADTAGSKLDDMIKEGQQKNLKEGARVLLGDGLPLVTSDHNVIQVQAVVQYIIKDPKLYIYGSEGAELMLSRAATAALLDQAATTSVDDLLTTARTEVQSNVRQAMNGSLRPYGLGVEVAGIELQKVFPPEAVAASFRSVNTAREEMNTIVNEAVQYQQTVVPQAQGEADKMVAEAQAYRSTREAEARGEASRFNGVLREFASTGPLTGERIRLETMERTLQKANKVQVGGSARSPLNITITPPPPGSGQ